MPSEYNGDRVPGAAGAGLQGVYDVGAGASGFCVFGGRSVLKRALYEAVAQDVERYEELARKAAISGDDELAGFFGEVRDENRRRAERARRLLAQRVAE